MILLFFTIKFNKQPAIQLLAGTWSDLLNGTNYTIKNRG